MSSQYLIGKELCRIGRAVLDLVRSRHLSSVGAGGFTRSSLVALGIFCALPVAATAALYLSIPDETLTAAPNQVLTTEVVRLPDLRGQIAAIEAIPDPISHDIFVRPAETLSSLLARLSIRDPQAADFIARHHEAGPLIYPHAGQFVSATANEDGLLQDLKLYLDSNVTDQGSLVHVWRDGQGKLSLEVAPYEYEVELTLVNGFVGNSVDESLHQSKVPQPIVRQMHSAFDYDLDLVSQLKKGDAYRLIYETKFAEGSFVRYGRLLAMQLDHNGQTTELFWFGGDGIGGNYYDAKGNIAKRIFMRVPLDVKSVSSEFSPLRRHPITGVVRPHWGTDFRAPWGAIVRAAADGVVTFAGVGTGYGKYIRINHGPDIQTLYAHLSSIDPDIKKGSVVKHGQIIGRVGQTGLATGPHLHYELKMDGVQINPMTVRLPDEKTLSPYRYAQMEVLIAPLRARLSLLKKVQTVGLSRLATEDKQKPAH